MVISPEHGSIDYDWEEVGFDTCFPSNTGVVYVKNEGTYQCTVGEETIAFEVLGNHLVRNSNGVINNIFYRFQPDR